MRGVDLPFGKVRTNGADELKILIFLNSLAGGGTERVAATLANFWARKQWNVTVVTLNPESDDFYRLDPLVNRISLDLAAAWGVYRRVGTLLSAAFPLGAYLGDLVQQNVWAPLCGRRLDQ
jgi:hypothetical protein